jgi:heat shock protein HslJ
MKKTYAISLILLTLLSSGCNSSVASSDNTIIKAGSQNSDLDTLSTDDLDLKQTLVSDRWTNITMNLSRFNSINPTYYQKSYLIELDFEDGKLTAYADCQKLTARYKISDNDILFSKITYNADDKAFCQPSEDADQALYEFLNNSFEATDIQKDEITFKADYFDTEVTLKR